MFHKNILRLFIWIMVLAVVIMPSLSPDDFAAVVLKKLITPGAQAPGLEHFSKLREPLREVAYLGLLENGQREARIRAELVARGEVEVLGSLALADPNADLALFELAGGWQFVGLETAYAPLPPLQWVVDGVLARPSLSIFFGPPKALKSLLLTDLAICTAIGGKWLTNPQNDGGFATDACPVAWLDLENGPRRMAERFAAFGKARSAPVTAPVRYLSMPTPWPDFSQPGSGGMLISRLVDMGAGLVVIDHLSQTLGDTDENTSEMSQIMAALRGVAEHVNAALILVHHQTKSAGRFGITASDSLRGHGSILASCDLACVIERNTMTRDGVMVKPVAIRGAPLEPFSGQFTFEHKPDGSKELATARFWGSTFESLEMLIEQAIYSIIESEGELNQSQLRAAVANEAEGAGDPAIRKMIARLEQAGRIKMKPGKKTNEKIYFLPKGG